MVFLHGFGCSPSYYLPLLNHLANQFEIIAPKMFGINYLKKQPVSINDYTELALDFCSSLRAEPYCVVGHSMGSIVAFKTGDILPEYVYLVGMNPVLPVDYDLSGFIARVIYKNIRESFGITGGVRAIRFGMTILPFAIFNLLRNMGATIHTVEDIRNFSYQKRPVAQPTLILYGEKDEFFKLDGEINDHLKDSFAHVTIKRLKKFNHDWPIFYPKLAAQEIGNFIQ